MKFHKVILAITALIILFNEAESQFQPTPTDPLFPPITPTPTPTPPPHPHPPPPSTPKTTPSPPPPQSTSITPSAPLTTSALPSVPSSPSVPPPQSSLPVSSSPASSKSPNPSPSSSAPSSQFDCSVLRSCSDPKTYCDIPAGKCRSKKNLGDQCNNDDHECLDPFVCRENTCGYSDVATANARSKGGSNSYNVKRVAIFGAIVVGAAGICGLVFFVIRYLKKKRDYDVASRLYSTDDDMSETDPYPFAERSNSFSQNTVQPPRVPTTNRYDNLPPTGNRGFAPRPGYQNYYNKYGNEGMYMRQNVQNIPNEERTMNLLQQTRGNVMVTPQQNYYNPAMRMNQGGLFPVPSVNVVPNNMNNVPPPNNANNVVPPPNNTNNMRNFNSPREDDESKHDRLVKTLRYSVDYTNDNHHHQTNNPKVVRKDSNTLSSDDGPKLKSDGKKETKSRPNMSSKGSKEKFEKTHSTYDPSVLDTYARDSTYTKVLGTKLSQSSMKYSDEPNASTIQHKISRTQIVNDI